MTAASRDPVARSDNYKWLTVAIAVLGMIGTFAWNAVAAADLIGYELWSDEVPDGPCLVVAPDVTEVRVAGTRCYGYVRVRACDDELCGEFSNEAEVVACACLECGEPECGPPPGGFCSCPAGCEVPCWPGAPYRLPPSRRCEA